MKFTIVVQGAPQSSSSPISALKFARAVVAAGHELVRVFFYHDAVETGNLFAVPPQDEGNPGEAWSDFATEHGIELIVCVASALRRGMVDESEAQRYEKDGYNIQPPFVISGLGQLIDASINADRVVTFAS